MNSNLVSYYSDRAKEYEKIYFKPERQNDIEVVTAFLQETFLNKEVLEVACGTGFWTERISKTAKKIFATDINNSVIEIAQAKKYNTETTFQTIDLYELPADTKFESALGAFIWSHIKLEELDVFLSSVCKHLLPGGTIVFVDNNYVEGSNTPIYETDARGNTYQARKLEDGTQHSVLKNFPTETAVRLALKEIATEIDFVNLTYFWAVKCKLKI